MLRESIRLIISWLGRAINEPLAELSRWQRAARFAYDLGRYGARQLRENRAPQMASALAFRTLFGLAPVLVVTTILIKAIKGPAAIIASLSDLLVDVGLDEVRIGPAAEVDGAPVVTTVNLAEWLKDLTSQLVNEDMSTVGSVGVAVIVYAAIGLMVTIENSFNIIYRAPDGRPWTRRVPLYWFILTISPVMIGLTSYVSKQFTSWIDSVDTWLWLLFTARWLWSFGLAWLFMFAVYTLVPNSTVALRPAVAGAFAATVLLGVGKNSLGAYLGNAFSINQLYGSLGLVPLFMFWVYLMWLAVLFGLQVSATLQMLHGRSLQEMDPPRMRTGMVDPTSVLTVMEVAAEHFLAGKPVTSRQVAEITSLQEPTVGRIVEQLVQEGWLHHVERPEAAISLAKPAGQMKANDLLRIGFRMVDEGQHGRCSALAQQLRDAQQAAANGITLATLVPASG